MVDRAQEEVEVLDIAVGTPVTQADVAGTELARAEQVQRQVFVAAPGVGLDARRKTVGLRPADRCADLAAVGTGARRQVRGARRKTAAPRAGVNVGLVGVARDDIDDSADCVATEQRRTRALDDFDAFDHLRCDVLHRGAADRARVDTHAVDEYQRVIAFGALQEHRRSLPRAAVAADIDAGFEAQQLGEVGRQRQLDVIAGDYAHRHDRVVDGDLGARCRDNDVIRR